ncbi:MAG: hypothetical protein ABGY75_11185 [Gemmataceae bacterium]
MSSMHKFLVAAVLAVGGLTGAAVIDSPLVGTQKAAAGGVSYFRTYADAKSFAAKKKGQGYYTKILKTTGGLYRVDYWSGH